MPTISIYCTNFLAQFRNNREEIVGWGRQGRLQKYHQTHSCWCASVSVKPDGDAPEALLSRTPLKRKRRPGRPLDADVVVRRGIQGVLLLSGVLKALEEFVSSVLVFGNSALSSACTTSQQVIYR